MKLGALIAALEEIKSKIGTDAKIRVVIEKNDVHYDFPATSIVYDEDVVSVTYDQPNKKELN